MTYTFTLNLSLENEHCIISSPNALQFQKIISLEEIRLIASYDAVRGGKELFRTFFNNELCRSFEQADVNRLLISSDNDLFLRLNWEYLHDDLNFVLPHRGIALLRVRRKGVISPSLQLECPPLRILLTTSVLAEPNIPKDIEIVRKLSNMHPLLIQVTVEKNIASTRLAYRFTEANQRNEPYHIWHHCGVISDDKTPSIQFSDKNLSIQDVNTILANSLLTKMVLLHLTGGDLVAIALTLARPVVIGFGQFHSQQIVEQWLSKFYSEILLQSVDEALSSARTAVYKSHPTVYDWAAPITIANTLDLRFFDSRQIESLSELMSPDKALPLPTTLVNTGGGSAIGHDVHINKGDYVSRDKIVHHHHYPSAPVTSAPPTTPKVNRILFLAANPTNTKTLRINREMAILDEKIRLSVHRTRFELVKYGAVRYFDLSDHLLNNESQIVHFSVHGSEGGNLLFEDEKDKKHPVTPESLGLLLEEFSSTLRLVIFNACWSYEHAQAICQSVDCVVGMGLAISDIAALNFTRGFYEALFSGRSVASAFKLGCSAIGIASRPGEVDTPQLLTKDGVDASTIRFI